MKEKKTQGGSLFLFFKNLVSLEYLKKKNVLYLSSMQIFVVSTNEKG